MDGCAQSFFPNKIDLLDIYYIVCNISFGSLHKLLSKLLSSRLTKVMNSIILTSQSGFLKGRNLVDGVLIVNEVVDLAKRSNRECMIFKVDFEKDDDSVDCVFLST